jgi:23S rRNA (uracil-5-)-methyltransferase RumA
MIKRRREPSDGTGSTVTSSRPSLAVGDVIALEVTGLLQNGQGLGRVDGLVVFTWGPLPGERATARVTEVKAKYAVAETIEITQRSADRVEPFCPLFGVCGGCQVQHLDYQAQLRWKRTLVEDALHRIGGLRDVAVAPTIGMDEPRAYRNKTALVVQHGDEGPTFGFYRLRTHAVVSVEHCPVAVPALDDAIGALRNAAREPAAREAFAEARHVVMRFAPSNGEGVAAITTRRRDEVLRAAAPALAAALPGVVGIANSYDPAGENAVLGRRTEAMYGRQEIEETVAGLRFGVSSHSFFQINGHMLEEIFARLRPLVRPGSALVDLYCGPGTFALFFAACGASVVGIEEDPNAVREARANANRNGLAERVRFLAGRVERSLGKGEAGARALHEADVAFLDPPRKGSDEATLGAIAAARVPEIWYLSCNPATLARDLAQLAGAGYAVGDVQPFDMFPQTGHVETLVRLRLDPAAEAARGAAVAP